MHTPRRHPQGFTLVELSVVLVIIGLLVGGVMVGQSMLKNQTLNKIGTEAANYRTMINQFKQQYGYFPGDFPTATSVWGRADGVAGSGDCATPLTDAAAATGTCNGNGDGIIANTINTSGFSNAVEGARAWQQMQLAKYLNTTVNGTALSSTSVLAGGTTLFFKFRINVGLMGPAGALPQSLYAIDSGYRSSWVSPTGAAPWTPSSNIINYIVFTSDSGSTNVAVYPDSGPGILSSADARSIDMKFDDGVSTTGLINGAKNTCFSGGDYSGTDVANQCALVFLAPIKSSDL